MTTSPMTLTSNTVARKQGFFFLMIVCVLFLSGCSSSKDESTGLADDSVSVTMNSFTKARTVLEAAITAHGGSKNIQALETVSLEYNGLRHMINQSRKAESPWDKEPSLGKVVADLKNKRLYSHSSNAYPGIGAFAGTWVVIGNEGFQYEPEKNYLGNEISRLSGDDIHFPWNYCRRWLPPLLLVQAMEGKSSLRWSGFVTRKGRKLEAVNFPQPHGAPLTLFFDAGTHLLDGFETIRDDGVYGDVTEYIRFEQYADFQNVKLPVKRTDYFNKEIARELTMTIAVNSKIDEALFVKPTGYVAPDENAKYTRILKVEDGVYIDTDMGGTMFVEFKDFVLVLDCPGDFYSSQSTIDQIRETIPGKEIKFIVTSHTHGDHGGGVRAYYYLGSTLITTPGHVKFYKDLANIQQSINPDSLFFSPKEPLIETFTDAKTVSDGIQTVELHNAGPNDHSMELTFAYLPRQKILWQTDMFFVPDKGVGINKAMPITVEFAKKLKELKIDDFRIIIDSHNSRLMTRAQFKESLGRAGYHDF